MLAAERWRSSVSRGYYATFTLVVSELSGKANFPPHRETPSHDDLPEMLFDYLTRLSIQDRWLYRSLARRMYQHRVSADYRQSQTVDRAEALQVVNWAEAFAKAMETAYG